jgi:outer membrane lipoprotein SlyB
MRILIRGAFVLVLAAPCATAQVPPAAGECDRCGRVEAVRPVTASDSWTPLGTTSSGVGGSNSSDSPTGNPTGVTMYQIGKGMTKQGTVLLGSAGGGMYKTRPAELNTKRWEVIVRMDGGDKRALTQNYEPMLREGDRVRVRGSQIELVQ